MQGNKSVFSLFISSPNKADFIRAKYQFLSFVNKQKDSDIQSVDDLSRVSLNHFMHWALNKMDSIL